VDPEGLRLALGAFLTSPGFGGVAAVVAAMVAVRGIRIRLLGDRELAEQARQAEREADRDSEARARWWDLARWVDAQVDAGSIPHEGLMDLLETMADSVTTKEQSVMLECVLNKLTGGASDGR
jgi:hypothetical protein